MTGREDRRTDLERRQRVDDLLARVSAAREEIVEAGLDAVHDTRAADAAPASERFARDSESGADAAGVSCPGCPNG